MRTRWQKNGYVADLQGSLLNSDGDTDNSSFFRPKVDISKTFKKLKGLRLGVYGEREKNSRFAPETDTLLNTSFYYDLFRIYAESKANDNLTLGINYSQRYDYAPKESEFQQSTYATDVNLTGTWRQKAKSQLRWNFNYRQLEIRDTTLSALDPQETFLGELEHSIRLWRGVVRSSTSYQISSGQEPRIEYQYIPVAAGQGNYQWTDLNQDSTVQLDEIQEIAFTDQGNAVRVTLFTDDFIRTHNVQLNQSLFIQPPAAWRDKKGLQIPSRLSAETVLVINRRTRRADDVSPWNPFQLSVADTSLVSVSSRIRGVLYYNRAHEKMEWRAGLLDSRNKAALTSGFESRGNEEQYLYTRWNLHQLWSLEVQGTLGQRYNDSEFFNNRDYDIDFFKVEPKLTFQPSTKFNIRAGYKLEWSENQLPETGELARLHDVKMEVDLRQIAKTTLQLNGSFTQVQFDGEPNSPIEFAMLQGLQNGQNFQWSISIDRRLSDAVQLLVSYEGRKTGLVRPVHVGRMQVRAVF